MEERNIIKLLDRYYIPYVTEGNNVSENFLGINCPYCNDPSEHLGISKTTGIFSCWRCNTRGNLYTLFVTLVNISKEEYEATVEKGISFAKSPLEQIQEMIAPEQTKEEILTHSTIALPECSYPITKDMEIRLLTKYLKRRQISLDTCIKHRCFICKAGKYMHRLIIPIFYNKIIVSYQGADLTGRADVKYRTAPGNVNNYIYNYDNIKDTMVITEGILDAWRVGNLGTASFGTSISKNQRTLIIEKKLKNLIFAWDNDAYWKAREQADYFIPFIDNVYLIHFPKSHDPDSFGKEFGQKALDKLLYD